MSKTPQYLVFQLVPGQPFFKCILPQGKLDQKFDIQIRDYDGKEKELTIQVKWVNRFCGNRFEVKGRCYYHCDAYQFELYYGYRTATNNIIKLSPATSADPAR